MIKKNKPIKKIQLKNLSDARTLLTNLGKTALVVGTPRLKPVANVITGAKNLVTGSINAYKAGRRVEQFKRSGQHSFQNLSQKEKLMKESSPMTKMEFNFPFGSSKASQGSRDVIKRGEAIIGRKSFRDPKSSVGTSGDTPSMNMTQMEQHMRGMSVGNLKKMGQFEEAILKQRKPKVKG
tara:strand:+ start:686 stop:1225 length:540 start_codon:yes stop_codon:yes gene_type:complete